MVKRIHGGKFLAYLLWMLIIAELYQAFAKEGEQNILKENDGSWPKDMNAFSEVFCSQEEFIQGLQEDCPLWERVYYYYTEDGIGFSYPVIYALGGHKEVELTRHEILRDADY